MAKKNTAFTVGLTLYTSSGGFVAAPTSLNAQISKDFGAWTGVGASSIVSTVYGQIKLALNSSEMNADLVMLYVTDTGTPNCTPFTAAIYTSAQTLDEVSTAIYGESARLSTTIQAESTRLSTAIYGEGARLSTLVDARSSAVSVASFGATPLQQVGVIGQGTAQQSSSNSLTLASTAAFATGEIVGATLLAAGGQPRMVLTYDSTSKIATVDAYVTTPSSVASYLLFGTPPASALSVPGVRVVSMDTNVISAAALTSSAVSLVADGLLNRDMSVGADSGSSAVRTPRQALRFLRNKWAVDGSTVTVMKEDDTTASWTAVLTASSAAVPITGADPA